MIFFLILLFFGFLNSEFKLGLENIPDKLNIVLTGNNGRHRKPRIALITNQSGLTQSGIRNIDFLVAHRYRINKIYVPEHGFQGHAKSGEKVTDTIDKKTKIKVLSLYEGNGRHKKFTKSDLADIDIIMFDMQDSGMRHFTYVSTMYKMMNIAAEFKKRFIVLDRPNPLGHIMEGPLVDEGLKSFISIESFPVRHGLTLGELALYFNKYSLKKTCKLQVVEMKDYDRRIGLNGKLNAFISPGLRTMESCFGYSFLGLLGEVKPFAIGLKSGNPFQCIMLDKKHKVSNKTWNHLQKILKEHNIDSERHEYCLERNCYEGLILKFGDINEVHAFSAFLAVLFFFKEQGIDMDFSKDFDLAIGTTYLRKYLNGEITKEEFVAKINNDLNLFKDRISPFLLYEPYPKIVNFVL